MKDLRTTIHSAYSFLRGVEENKAYAALTLDHLIQEQVKRLKRSENTNTVDPSGNSIRTRSSQYDRLTKLEEDITKVVSTIRSAGNDAEKLESLGLQAPEGA